MLNNVTGLWRFLGGFAGMYVIGHIFVWKKCAGYSVGAQGVGETV